MDSFNASILFETPPCFLNQYTMYDNNKFRYTKLSEALKPKFLYSGTNKNCNFTYLMQFNLAVYFQ